MKNSLTYVLTLLACALFSGSAHANTLQCGETTINLGDDSQKVLESCGQPAQQVENR